MGCLLGGGGCLVEGGRGLCPACPGGGEGPVHQVPYHLLLRKGFTGYTCTCCVAPEPWILLSNDSLGPWIPCIFCLFPVVVLCRCNRQAPIQHCHPRATQLPSLLFGKY
jgi:hypothetical protein